MAYSDKFNPQAGGSLQPEADAQISGKWNFNYGRFVAAGSVQNDATLLKVNTPASVVATGADATKGVKLPKALPGSIIFFKNGTNAVLKVWPSTGDAINAISANSSMSLAALVGTIFHCPVKGQWYTIPLLPS